MIETLAIPNGINIQKLNLLIILFKKVLLLYFFFFKKKGINIY